MSIKGIEVNGSVERIHVAENLTDTTFAPKAKTVGDALAATTSATHTGASGTNWTWSTIATHKRNGVVMLKIEGTFAAAAAVSGYVVVASGLPAGIANTYHQLTDMNGNPYKVRLLANGEMAINTYSNTALSVDTTIIYIAA